MRKWLNRLLNHIFRSWEDEPNDYTHPLIKVLPPIFYELLSYFIVLAILWAIIKNTLLDN